MILSEQEFHVIDNRAEDRLLVSSTHPRWTRALERLERRGVARRTRTITGREDAERRVLGGEWELDREAVVLRLTVRRKATEAQRRAAAKATAVRFGRETNAGAAIAASNSLGANSHADPSGSVQEDNAGAIVERQQKPRRASATAPPAELGAVLGRRPAARMEQASASSDRTRHPVRIGRSERLANPARVDSPPHLRSVNSSRTYRGSSTFRRKLPGHSLSA